MLANAFKSGEIRETEFSVPEAEVDACCLYEHARESASIIRSAATLRRRTDVLSSFFEELNFFKSRLLNPKSILDFREPAYRSREAARLHVLEASGWPSTAPWRVSKGKIQGAQDGFDQRSDQ